MIAQVPAAAQSRDGARTNCVSVERTPWYAGEFERTSKKE